MGRALMHESFDAHQVFLREIRVHKIERANGNFSHAVSKSIANRSGNVFAAKFCKRFDVVEHLQYAIFYSR